MRKLISLALVLSWWFVFYGDGRRYGPFIERGPCEQTAANLRAAGISAACVEVPS